MKLLRTKEYQEDTSLRISYAKENDFNQKTKLMSSFF